MKGKRWGMVKTPDADRRNEGTQRCHNAAALEDVRVWFVREVLPLEPALTQFLHRNWRRKDDIPDLRNDIYVLVYEAARRQFPEKPRQFVFTTARNLLINQYRREHVVAIEAVTDLDALGIALDVPGPEHSVIARDQLRQLQAAIDRLPPRCREVIVMRRIEGLSRPEIAQRLGISEETISAHVTDGMCALAEMFYGEAMDFRRKP